MDKKTLRTEIRRQIAELDEDYISKSNHEILKALLLLPEYLRAPRVFTYFSVGNEVDTRLFISCCLKHGKQVALPVCLDAGGMSFALPERPCETLTEGKFGIPQPAESAQILVPRENDLIVVPALSYDLSGNRLGQGGGYYDRYLAGCKAFSVGLCHETLLSHSVPVESFDLAVDCLITEKRIARPKKVPQK